VRVSNVEAIAGYRPDLVVVPWLARRRLNGVTGDVMGAAVELAATAALVAQPVR
jgi:cobalamin synthase